MVDSRERRLTEAFVTLADTLVDDYDVVDLLQTLVETVAEVLDATAVGLALADDRGLLAVVASTSENNHIVDLMQPESWDSPSAESFRTGKQYSAPDLETLLPREFATTALKLGFKSLHSVPMRLRADVIGALTLFRTYNGPLTVDDVGVMQGLADVATIGILHERALRESDIAQQQLQQALSSRVVIEQAKGVIAQTRSLDMDSAFRLLRDYARSNQLNLRDVAELVVRRSITI
jgi:GAF domain-containing protein